MPDAMIGLNASAAGRRLGVSVRGGRTSAVRASAEPVRVSFRMPYRCDFGQRLKLVGSGALGGWDVSASPSLAWSDGDVWRADLELDLASGEAIEYKYVVVNDDGWCAAWRPGANISLALPVVEAHERALYPPRVRSMRITDSWDGSSRGMQVEVDDGRGTLAEALEAAGLPPDAELGGVFLAMQGAIAELDQKMSRTLEVVEGLADPGAAEAVHGDREVAAAARKALALARAVEASREAKALAEDRGAHGSV